MGHWNIFSHDDCCKQKQMYIGEGHLTASSGGKSFCELQFNNL